MQKIVRKNILGVKPYTPGKPIEEVQRELELEEVIKLASNEHFLGPSPKALAAIKGALNNINRYPDANCFYLKKKAAEFLGVKAENLIFGNGSDEVIGIAMKTFVGEGDEVVIARPTFLIYEIMAQIQGARIKFVPLKEGFKYDLAAMKRAVTKDTKMVFIANPDNPTSTYVTRNELEAFLDGLPAGLVVFLDEAYFEFAKNSAKDYPNGLDYFEKYNVIVARSFSKAYGLAGLRVGYGVASSGIISFMDRVREPFNVNILAQAAATAALGDKSFLKDTLAHVEKEKTFLYSTFKDMGIDYVKSATNFILFDVKVDCKKVFGKLLKKGVIVRDMMSWGLDTYLRVTVGTRAENMKFIAALKEVLD